MIATGTSSSKASVKYFIKYLMRKISSNGSPHGRRALPASEPAKKSRGAMPGLFTNAARKSLDAAEIFLKKL
jgi:hypothetical protein